MKIYCIKMSNFLTCIVLCVQVAFIGTSQATTKNLIVDSQTGKNSSQNDLPEMTVCFQNVCRTSWGNTTDPLTFNHFGPDKDNLFAITCKANYPLQLDTDGIGGFGYTFGESSKCLEIRDGICNRQFTFTANFPNFHHITRLYSCSGNGDGDRSLVSSVYIYGYSGSILVGSDYQRKIYITRTGRDQWINLECAVNHPNATLRVARMDQIGKTLQLLPPEAMVWNKNNGIRFKLGAKDGGGTFYCVGSLPGRNEFREYAVIKGSQKREEFCRYKCPHLNTICCPSCPEQSQCACAPGYVDIGRASYESRKCLRLCEQDSDCPQESLCYADGDLSHCVNPCTRVFCPGISCRTLGHFRKVVCGNGTKI